MSLLKLLFIFFFVLSAPELRAQGAFRLFKKAVSYSTVQFPRDIYVYLPEGYAKSAARYPVLYMHDGQNLFDPARAFLGQTWNAEKTLNELIARKLITPIIVVAIDNTSSRMDEYIPEKQADAYLDFVLNDVKPVIDQSFRTKSQAKFTGMMGSSLGGLVSLYAGLKHTDTVGLVAALSPSIWYNNRSILSSYQSSPYLPMKVYLDSGTDGGEKPQDVLDLGQVLKTRGFQNPQTYFTYIQNGADHREYYWAQRLPGALQFLFHL